MCDESRMLCLFELRLLIKVGAGRVSLTIFKTVQISQINCSPLLLIWSSFNFPGNSQIIFPDFAYSQWDLCFRDELFQYVELLFFILYFFTEYVRGPPCQQSHND